MATRDAEGTSTQTSHLQTVKPESTSHGADTYDLVPFGVSSWSSKDLPESDSLRYS